MTRVDTNEERLVAELESLGVRYLSRQAVAPAVSRRSPAHFLSDLVRQPTSRVRTALIAALLAQPDLAAFVPEAITLLKPDEQLTLKLLYTAAVILQQKYADRLRVFLGSRWQRLPDLYSAGLGIRPGQAPEEGLRSLGLIHCQVTGVVLNWSGTYENVVQHLLHRWEKEKQWNL